MPTTTIRYFESAHLPPALQAVSAPIGDLARQLEESIPDGPEKSAGMRKLLEAKDCFVRAVLVLVLALAVFGLTACQSAPQVAPQGQHQDSGGGLTSPVDQTGTNARSVIIAPTIVLPNGTGDGAVGEDGTKRGGIIMSISIGSKSDGDLRSAESLRNAQQGGTQTSTPTQTVAVDPAAVGKAAADLLATVAPAGEAASLLKSAIDQAHNGSPTLAADLLAAGKAKAAKEKAPAETPVTPPPTPAPAPPDHQ